jgi:hypothetical protein
MRKKSTSNTRVTRSSPIDATPGKARGTRLTLELSPEAGEKLQRLLLNSLNQRGEMPDVAEVIERLIENASRNVPETPYPESG